MAKLYGFNLKRATTLNRVADREGVAPRTKGGRTRYATPLLEPTPRLGSLNATLNAGSTAEATEITHDGSEFVNGDTFTVTDFFMNEGESVAADTKIIAFPVGGLWVPIPYCAVSDTLPE